jgi:hypothetical protein
MLGFLRAHLQHIKSCKDYLNWPSAGRCVGRRLQAFFGLLLFLSSIWSSTFFSLFLAPGASRCLDVELVLLLLHPERDSGARIPSAAASFPLPLRFLTSSSPSPRSTFSPPRISYLSSSAPPLQPRLFPNSTSTS